jgi:hypothetical protein
LELLVTPGHCLLFNFLAEFLALGINLLALQGSTQGGVDIIGGE